MDYDGMFFNQYVVLSYELRIFRLSDMIRNGIYIKHQLLGQYLCIWMVVMIILTNCVVRCKSHGAGTQCAPKQLPCP